MTKAMKTLTRFAACAAMAGAAMTAIVEPANAGVSVGIGIGVPGPAPAYHRDYRPDYRPDYRYGSRWCYWHPRACAAPAPAFAVGTFYPGRGWWDGHAWYHDRFMAGGHWRYR